MNKNNVVVDYIVMMRVGHLVVFILLLLAMLSISFFTILPGHNSTRESTSWTDPFNTDDSVKIRCLNGSLVEFVSDCPSPEKCRSLQIDNNILECLEGKIQSELKG